MLSAISGVIELPEWLISILVVLGSVGFIVLAMMVIEGKLTGVWLATRNGILDAIASCRSDPLARSLAKFQREADRKLCYGEIARMEHEIYGGDIYTDCATGQVFMDGPRTPAPPSGLYAYIRCGREECRTHGSRYYGGY